MSLIQILTLIVVVLIFLIVILVFAYWYMSMKSKKDITNNIKTNKKENAKNLTQYTKLSIFDFMEFDKIEDNMIIQKNGEKYLMVVECEGINYDLMSAVEKTSVEAGFVQFLNTLRHPIQLYTQTRTINIVNSIENYKTKINEIKEELNFKQNELKQLLQSGEYSQKEVTNLKIEIARNENLYDYGKDIVANIETISQNKNVLKKNYYIVIPYYSLELGNHIENEEEKRNMIFSELYTRAQAVIRTLFACSMKCRVLDSNELVELLYVAYNRDESEIYGIDKALKAGYAELYSTAPDVMDKRMQALNKEIEEKALNLAKEKVDEAKSKKEKNVIKKELSFDELMKKMAIEILKQNKQYVGDEIAKEAIAEIEEDTNKKGGSEDESKPKKGTRRVTEAS